MSSAVRSKSNVRMVSLDDASTMTWEALGEERPGPSHSGIVLSVPKVTGDDAGDLNFGNTPSGSAFEPEQRHEVPSNTQGLVNDEGMLAPDNGFDLLSLAECGLHECLTLMDLGRVLTNYWTKAESSVAGFVV